MYRSPQHPKRPAPRPLRPASDICLLRTAALCALLSALSFGWYILKNGGFFSLSDDFNVQQLPFFAAMRNTLFSGGWDSWVWNLDLGTALIPGFSFYGLGSPFFWLIAPFPAPAIPYLAGPLYILRYTAAGAFSYLYFRRFVSRKNRCFAQLGAVLYAFCGFQSVNLIYQFHDAAALFPLLLIALESAMGERDQSLSPGRGAPRRRTLPGFLLFSAAVALNCVNNYYCFVQDVFFLLLYFLLRFRRRPAEKLRAALRLLASGVLGVSMAGFLFVPSILYVRSSPRAFSLFPLTRDSFFYPFRFSLMYLKGLLMPAEAMSDQSAIFPFNYDSASCYLPLIGMTLVLAYMLRRRDRLSALLGLLLLCSFVPILSSAFALFSADYKRWWYALALMCVLASVRVLCRPEDYPVRASAAVNLLLILLLYLAARFMRLPGSFWPETLVYHSLRLTLFSVIAALGICAAAIFLRMLPKHRAAGIRFLTIGISLSALVTTFLSIRFYLREDQAPETYLTDYLLGTELRVHNPQYRYTTNDNVLTLTGEAAGTGSFSSTVSHAVTRFDEVFDYYSPTLRMDVTQVPGLRELLGAGYLLSDSVSDPASALETLEIRGKTYYIVSLPASLIGYAVQNTISREELRCLDLSLRGIAMLDCAVIDPDKEEEAADFAPLRSVAETDFERSIFDYCARNAENAVSDFTRSTGGFSCTADYEQNRAVYFSVPNDEGWTAYIDGTETEILDSAGMMLLLVPAGEHRIEFRYRTPGFRAGALLSICSSALFIMAGIWYYKRQQYPEPSTTAPETGGNHYEAL
ncbi:YfhO family protein [Lachnoclostridium sp. Marseille-P6806]|uniref:YfhO family protein n=1 Tax=Lachnoclostridium sp. Marseille-P6806 TaxID=2364793 RepID=UPI0013EF52E0|nr:YfhO family protein [Lachnoclostridium sp. Marseille-P6806]